MNPCHSLPLGGSQGKPLAAADPLWHGCTLPPSTQAWLWRWRRFGNDCRAAANLRSWLPVILGSTLASGLILALHAAQGERARNELIRRFATEKLDFLADNLTVETRDWSSWDETYLHVTGRHPAYYENGNYNRNTFLRTPFVMVLDKQGRPISTARWNNERQAIEPLSAWQRQALWKLIPQPERLTPRTFLAMFGGQPYLMSAQLIVNSRGDVPPAGRLLFVRPLSGPDNAIARTALSLQDYLFEPARPLASPPLGPLAIGIRHPRWDGLEPLQITILRPASERRSALIGMAVLLLLDLLLLLALQLAAYRQQRRLRHQNALQRRERTRLQRALERRDNSDALTGLLNEPGLLAAMERQRLQYPRLSRALLLIDIRHFALINNSFGRDFGDRVLIAFAQRLTQALAGSSVIARSGGDTFTCSLVGSSAASLRAEISRLSQELQQLDLQVGERTLRLSISAGARLLSDVTTEKALHETGVARDLAKLSGRSQCHFYGDEQTTMQNYIAIQRLNQELIASLKENRIALFAQAAWRLGDSGLPAVYVEFLARLHDPSATGRQRYRWSEALVEAACCCGSMPLLDGHVLELAFRSLAQLFRRHPGHGAIQRMVYAINITPDTLLADDFVRRIETLLDREGVDPARLCFEITEQAAVRNCEVVRSVMQRLRRFGIRFALDDFGAGMTSLSHLRDLPLDYVKIDKAFIWRIKGDPSSRLTVEFLVRLGRDMGFEIIAEGVENLHLLYYLRDLGVDIAQGYITAIPSLFEPRAGDVRFARSGRDLFGPVLAQVS